MMKRAYAIVRDRNGNPRFDDGTGATPAEIWNAFPEEAKEGYRSVMTEAEQAVYTMEGYNANS